MQGEDPPDIPRSPLIYTLAAGFVALFGVVIVLVSFGRQTRALHSELADIVEPANAALIDLQRVLGLQMAAQRGYVLGGAEESFANYRELLSEETQVYERLAPLIHELGPDATAALVRMRGTTERWHEAVERSASGAPVDGSGDRLSTRQGYFAVSLAQADSLAALIRRHADAQRDAIQERQRTEMLFVAALVVLAVFALVVLARVGQSLHAAGTEAARMARVAEERHEALLEVAREKETFMRGVTHDLKNPLGVIDGSAELLAMGARGELTPGQRAAIDMIRRAAAEMLGRISDLLKLSRAEAAALSLHPRPVGANLIARSAAEAYGPVLERQGQRLVLTLLEEDRIVHTDPDKVQEILGNLLTNAARHGSPGGVVNLGVSMDRPGERPGLSVTVTDDGPGIPLELRGEIFKEFARGPHSEGSGIGLAIGRKLARALGGDLVLSPPGNGGTAFTLQLPL